MTDLGGSDTNDAIQSLSRVGQASVRWIAKMHRTNRVADPEDELAHIRANLDRVEELLKGARR